MIHYSHLTPSVPQVWKHFITQTDDKRWTAGKRKAESDLLVGISFLTTIQAPSILTETESAIDRDISQFGKDIVKMDLAVKSLSSAASDQVTKYRTTNKKDYQVCRSCSKRERLCSSLLFRKSVGPSVPLALQWALAGGVWRVLATATLTSPPTGRTRRPRTGSRSSTW